MELIDALADLLATCEPDLFHGTITVKVPQIWSALAERGHAKDEILALRAKLVQSGELVQGYQNGPDGTQFVVVATGRLLELAAARRAERGDVDPPTSEPNRRGRKKADYETVQREAELAVGWERARDAGVYKPDFARDHKLTVRQLDALLDRVAKRKRLSD